MARVNLGAHQVAQRFDGVGGAPEDLREPLRGVFAGDK